MMRKIILAFFLAMFLALPAYQVFGQSYGDIVPPGNYQLLAHCGELCRDWRHALSVGDYIYANALYNEMAVDCARIYNIIHLWCPRN